MQNYTYFLVFGNKNYNVVLTVPHRTNPRNTKGLLKQKTSSTYCSL